jgi:hypothetical protein
MRPAYVHGVGLWTTGYASPGVWCAQTFDPEATRPEASLLVGPLRRRATPLTRMSVEAMGQAATMAGSDLTTLPSVWATAHGEHSVAIDLLAMMRRDEGRVSPTKFHNSVHNTASGYASIATGNRALSTTLTGGAELVVSALVEATCMLETLDRDLVLVLGDEALLPPFERSDARWPLAIAFALSPRPEGALAALRDLRRDAVSPAKIHDRFGRLHVSVALPLVEGIVGGRPGTLALELEGDARGAVWCLDLEILRHYPTDVRTA